MGRPRRSLAPAARALTAAHLAALGVPLAVLPQLTRALGIHAYGRLQTVLALGAFAGLLADPGLATVAFRRSARSPARVARLVGRIQPLRAGFALGAAALLVGVATTFDWSRSLRTLIMLQAAYLVVQAFGVDNYLTGIGDAAWVGYTRTASLLFYGAGILLFVRAPDDAAVVLLVSIATAAAVAVAGTLRLRRLAGPLTWRPSTRAARVLLGEAWLFGASSVMSIVYARIDILLLRILRGEAAVGLYAAAVRLTEGVYGVLQVIVGTLVPRAVMEGRRRRSRLSAYAHRALRIAGLVVVPAALGAVAAGGPLLVWIAGRDFGGGDVVVGLLGVTLVAGSLASIYTGFGLTGLGRARGVLASTALGAVVNVSLNVGAIPLFGPAGAAATTLLAQAVVAYSAHRLSSRVLRLAPWRALRPWMLPAGIMAVVVAVARWQGVSPAALLVLGILAYAAGLWAFGALARWETRGLRRLLGVASIPPVATGA